MVGLSRGEITEAGVRPQPVIVVHELRRALLSLRCADDSYVDRLNFRRFARVTVGSLLTMLERGGSRLRNLLLDTKLRTAHIGMLFRS